MSEPNADPVTFFRCRQCDGVIGWIDCPTGGWWAHKVHPVDEHDASPNHPNADPVPLAPILGDVWKCDIRGCVGVATYQFWTAYKERVDLCKRHATIGPPSQNDGTGAP